MNVCLIKVNFLCQTFQSKFILQVDDFDLFNHMIKLIDARYCHHVSLNYVARKHTFSRRNKRFSCSTFVNINIFNSKVNFNILNRKVIQFQEHHNIMQMIDGEL